VSLSVVTPWKDQPQLLPAYVRAFEHADEVLIVDTGSTPENAAQLAEVGTLVGFDGPFSYARACNLGLLRAQSDVVLVCNNDVIAQPEWLDAVRRDVAGSGLFGPSSGVRVVDDMPVPYIEGWCVAATRSTWQRLRGFDAEAYQRPYWEDVDLSFRALVMGIPLYRTAWRIEHLSNTTSRVTPGAYDASEANGALFAARVREHMARRAAA
jgi:GT2 family glycosyltransferase